ncbi:MAG: tol-pal system protein YbgF [Desulfobacterales bacterium]
MRTLGVLFTVAAISFLAAGCATRRDVVTIDTRLSEIEMRESEERRRREEFARAREANEAAIRQMAASLRAQMDELRDELRGLRGRVEELEFARQQAKTPAGGETGGAPREDRLQRVEESTQQLSQRVARVEEHLKLDSPPAAARPEPSRIRPESAAMPSEQELYSRAKQFFDQGNMPQARRSFEELLQRYPRSENADNAQFWIAETFYREKAYEKAILEYQKVIEKYPKGNKVPAALLKQGHAFLAIGDKVNSRLLFEEVIRKHPNTAEARTAAEKLKEIR